MSLKFFEIFFDKEDVTFARLARPLTMPVLCLASLSRSLVGVAGGASKVLKGLA
jgi:hypothetical protein